MATEAYSDVQALPLVLTPEEGMRLLRMGRSAFYDACRLNRIPHTRVGKHIRLSRDRLLAFIEAGGIDGQGEAPQSLAGTGGAREAGEGFSHVGRLHTSK